MLKKTVYRILSLCFLSLLLCSCNDQANAGKRLENELKVFSDRYMANEFNKQLNLNKNSHAWLTGSDKLLLLGFDGLEIFPYDPGHADLLGAALGRTFVGQELTMQCKSRVWSNLVKVEHEKYKYRCLLTFTFSETRRMWKHVAGVKIINVAIKSQKNESDIKNELMQEAVKYLVPEKTDYCFIYKNPTSVNTREYNVTLYACYDPALPGWVLEDKELANDIKLNIPAPDWLDMSIDKFKPGKELGLYNGLFFWKESKLIKKNYDEGLVYRYNRWMTVAIAEATAKLLDLVKNFDPATADKEQLSKFLNELAALPEELDFKQAYSAAGKCALNLINKMQYANDYNELVDFQMLVNSNSDYKVILPQISSALSQAVMMVKNRINQQLDNFIAQISDAGKNVVSAVSRDDIDALKMNIVLVRAENSLMTICTRDASKISDAVFSMRFAKMLKQRNIAEVNKLYKNTQKMPLIKTLEDRVLADCEVCRNGKQQCIYCTKNPGKCLTCINMRYDDAMNCSKCRGTGKCEHCKGTKRMKCMNCSGKGFIIRPDEVNNLFEDSLAAFKKLTEDNIFELKEKKIK